MSLETHFVSATLEHQLICIDRSLRAAWKLLGYWLKMRSCAKRKAHGASLHSWGVGSQALVGTRAGQALGQLDFNEDQLDS